MTVWMNSFGRLALITGGLFMVAVAFLIYSGAVTFSNWPWTKTETHTFGTVMGFSIGDSKLSCFRHAMVLEENGEIRALRLADAKPGTYDEKYKGTDLTDADFEAVRESNIWHVGLTGENAWLILTFIDGNLARLERKDYRGPTE